MSRCGIFARSTAWARPATSRPRAKVSFEPDAAKSSDSRIPRRVTTLKSWFGISMPTALLPGIGASIRRVRAARAIARSSARASIRLTLTCARRLDLVLGHDRAGVAADDLGRDVEARELLDDDVLGAAVDRLVAGRVDALDGRVEELDARQRRTRCCSRVGGESEASVMSSGSRTGRGALAPAAAPAAAGRRAGAPGVRAGANVAEVGTGDGIGGGPSSPQMPVWPGDVPGPPATFGRRAPGRPRESAAVGGGRRSRPRRGRCPAAGRRRPARGACSRPRSCRASAPSTSSGGAAGSSRRLKAISTPAIAERDEQDERAGRGHQRAEPSDMNRPTRPPPLPRAEPPG